MSALFLDRDGVIIHDAGYAKDASQVILMPGIVDLIRRAREANWKVIVVTNQSGLGRGWISLRNYQDVSERMIELLAAEQVALDCIYFCPFHEPQGTGPSELHAPRFSSREVPQVGLWDVAWRKPRPGMLLQAASEHGIDLSRSILVGDRMTDAVAGHLAGLAQTYLYLRDLNAAAAVAEMQELPAWDARLPGMRQELALSQASGDTRALSPKQVSAFAEIQLR